MHGDVGVIYCQKNDDVRMQCVLGLDFANLRPTCVRFSLTQNDRAMPKYEMARNMLYSMRQ
jgi:hypothetical protein